MRLLRHAPAVLAALLLAAAPALAADLLPDPAAPNEAVEVTAAAGAVPAPIADGEADELLFHARHPQDHQALLRPGFMAAHYIDVGQGSAILLEFSCGAALIDTGGQADADVDGNARLMAYLEAFFARRTDLDRTLDVVFLTHAHGDHTSGAATVKIAGRYSPGLIGQDLTAAFNIRGVVANAEKKGSGWRNQKKLLAWAADNGVPALTLRTKALRPPRGLTNGTISPLACAGGAPVFRVLWGSNPGRWASNGNNHSLVIRLDFGQASFLFPGDLEDSAEDDFLAAYAARPERLDVDVLAVGHHGAANGVTAAFVGALSPQLAVISSGDPSDQETGKLTAYAFAHPNRKAIALLTDPVSGVTASRPPVAVAVGVKGKAPGRGSAPPLWEEVTLDRAVYDTGWDGDIVVTASMAGDLRVHIRPIP